MKKRIASSLLAVFLLLAIPLTASADFDPETRNSVVVVETCLELDAGTVSFGWGTGFFVGEDGQDPTYLITNHHVIEPFLESGEGELVQAETTEGILTGRSKIRVYYDSDDYEEAYPVAYDEIKDLAVLKLGAAPLQPHGRHGGQHHLCGGLPGPGRKYFCGRHFHLGSH